MRCCGTDRLGTFVDVVGAGPCGAPLAEEEEGLEEEEEEEDDELLLLPGTMISLLFACAEEDNPPLFAAQPFFAEFPPPPPRSLSVVVVAEDPPTTDCACACMRMRATSRGVVVRATSIEPTAADTQRQAREISGVGPADNFRFFSEDAPPLWCVIVLEEQEEAEASLSESAIVAMSRRCI